MGFIGGQRSWGCPRLPTAGDRRMPCFGHPRGSHRLADRRSERRGGAVQARVEDGTRWATIAPRRRQCGSVLGGQNCRREADLRREEPSLPPPGRPLAARVSWFWVIFLSLIWEKA